MPVRHTLETFDWHFQPKLDRTTVEELADLGFLERKQDLIITGQPGTGKSHILGAIALRACLAGRVVRHARFVDLLSDLHAGLADGARAPSHLRHTAAQPRRRREDRAAAHGSS